ncbi:MAG: hypothetical protein JNM99_20065 [Verrucomicrobiaceae bacterium]|nr:hypothetical protein [Verrucomicrobiaceae bacterium]
MVRSALILSFALCTASLAMGADRYVSPTGSASNPGTLAAPWTMAKAASSAVAGDIVYVRGGTYTSTVSITVSGTATQPIIFRNYPEETPVFDLTGQTPPSNDSDAAIISILNRSHLIVQGFTLQNWRTSNEKGLPEGILIAGRNGSTCTNIRLLNNTIRNIEQNNTVKGNFNANAHGIKVAGRSTTPVTDIIVEGNHLSNLRLGASEALVINGNVTNFRVNNNVVHDCNNIGIDLIGFEGTLPSTLDRARDGVVSGNVVYNIDSSYNPAYKGDFTTGGGDRAAGGIYVDGGTRIIIERNLVFGCNFGVEVASEEDFGTGIADFITLRNNLLRHNQGAGLIMGGYNSGRGSTTNCTFINNTIYGNGTIGGGPQIQVQHHVSSNVFKNNIVVARGSTTSMVSVTGSAVSGFTGNTFSYNLYYAPSGSAPTFEASGSKNLSAWQAATSLSGGDVGSSAGDPKFIVSHPSAAEPKTAWQLASGSPAINTGAPSPGYQPGDAEDDFFGDSRLRDGRVDRGADEF